jgi:FkbM family methyltransferase
MIIKEISFNNNVYSYAYNETDPSGLGCVSEIIKNNEYGLERFNNITDKIFIDIGANHGVATIILAKQNPFSKIFSFEPNPVVFGILQTNVINNGLNNVILINKAVHSNKGLKLISHPHWSGGNIMGSDGLKLSQHYNTKKITEISVETISFDNFLVEKNITEIFLLKIDCEGSEFDIIGKSKILFKKTTISNIIGEFHDLSYNDVDLTSADLINLCKNNINGIIDVSILKL